jgi:ATP-dependent RNA helicase DeaD
MITKKLEWLDREELITRMVSLEFNRFLDYYKNARDINQVEERHERREKTYSYEGGSEPRGRERGGGREPRANRGSGAEAGYTRMFINLGRIDGIQPVSLIEIINKNTPGKKVPIGRIDLMKNFSFFEVESSYAKDLLNSFQNVVYDSRRISIEITREGPVEGRESRGGGGRDSRDSGNSYRKSSSGRDYGRDSRGGGGERDRSKPRPGGKRRY